MKYILKAALFLIAIVIIVSVIGCKNPASPGYVYESLAERDINFSFEYPEGYQKGPDNPYGDLGDVVGKIYIFTCNDTVSQKRISIQLWNPTTELPNAKARLDKFAANTNNAGKDSVISERSPLTIATISGEKLVYALTLEDVSIPSRLTGWVASFDYKGQVWMIVVITNMVIPDEAKADFEHLIKTLKFSD
jgi:hypothetical protein